MTEDIGMAVLRDTMLAMLAMAAVSEIVLMLGGDDAGAPGLGLMCGLCAAGCMLNICSALISILR